MSIVAPKMTLVVKNLSTNAGDIRDMSSITEHRKSPGRGCGNPLQYSCLENPMGRRTWWATAHRVARSLTWLKQLSTHVWKCLLTDKWIQKMWYVHTMEHFFSFNKGSISYLGENIANLLDIMSSFKSKKLKGKYCIIQLIWIILSNQTDK